MCTICCSIIAETVCRVRKKSLPSSSITYIMDHWLIITGFDLGSISAQSTNDRSITQEEKVLQEMAGSEETEICRCYVCHNSAFVLYHNFRNSPPVTKTKKLWCGQPSHPRQNAPEFIPRPALVKQTCYVCTSLPRLC